MNMPAIFLDEHVKCPSSYGGVLKGSSPEYTYLKLYNCPTLEYVNVYVCTYTYIHICFVNVHTNMYT